MDETTVMGVPVKILCAHCKQDITKDYVMHPVIYSGEVAYLCEHCKELSGKR